MTPPSTQLLSVLADVAKLMAGFLLAGLVVFGLSFYRSRKHVYKYQSLLLVGALIFEASFIGLSFFPGHGTEAILYIPLLFAGLLVPAALGILGAYGSLLRMPDDGKPVRLRDRLVNFSRKLIDLSGRAWGMAVLCSLLAVLPFAALFSPLVRYVEIAVIAIGLAIATWLYATRPAMKRIGLRSVAVGFACITAGFAFSAWFYEAAFFVIQFGVFAVVASFLVLQEEHFIQAERQAEEVREELRFIERHDTLTGLYNRTSFFERLSHESTQPERSRIPLAVLYLDLDHFRNINDSLGNEAGNYLLSAVAERLAILMSDTESVFRTGEDEFAILVPCPSSHIDAAIIAEEVVALFNNPFRIMGNEVFLSASIGIAFVQADDSGKIADSAEVSRQVDQALEHAKLDRNTYRFYTPGVADRSLSKLQYINFLRQAIDRHELSLHYQPQVDHEGRVVSAEALLRWTNPVLGSVPPSEFIALAEEAGLIIPIGEWVIEQACSELAHWRSIGIDLPMAINISTRQLKDPRLERILLSRLKKYGLQPHLMHLEITETSLLDDTEGNLETLNNLTGHGFKLSIDDFGTGYANLSYLKRLPISTVKIDRSFVVDLPDNQQDLAVVQAICAMARGLGLGIIAEGVESSRQLEILRTVECKVTQGFLFSRPLPSPDFIAYVQASA